MTLSKHPQYGHARSENIIQKLFVMFHSRIISSKQVTVEVTNLLPGHLEQC